MVMRQESWEIILGMGSANERRRYNVTSSLIGWAHTKTDPHTATKSSQIFGYT